MFSKNTDSTIIFDGVQNKGNIPYLIFIISRNDDVKYCEVPTDEKTARHILTHLSKHVMVDPKPVERGNDEPSFSLDETNSKED